MLCEEHGDIYIEDSPAKRTFDAGPDQGNKEMVNGYYFEVYAFLLLFPLCSIEQSRVSPVWN